VAVTTLLITGNFINVKFAELNTYIEMSKIEKAKVKFKQMLLLGDIIEQLAVEIQSDTGMRFKRNEAQAISNVKFGGRGIRRMVESFGDDEKIAFGDEADELRELIDKNIKL